jgi:hypothetical protein
MKILFVISIKHSSFYPSYRESLSDVYYWYDFPT